MQKVTDVLKRTEWISLAHKHTYHFCVVCLSIYLSYVAYFANSSFGISLPSTVRSFIFFGVCAVLFYYVLNLLCKWSLQQNKLNFVTQKRYFSWRFFSISVFISVIILLMTLLAHYPGGVSYDAYNQWSQIQSGQYNNWHPVFHTLLIKLIVSIYNNYTFVITVQIFFFAFALAYLMTTIYRYGFSKMLLLGMQILILLSEPVSNPLMYVWKDCAFTIGMLVLCTYCVRIYYTRGKWLFNFRNCIMLGIVLAVNTLIRHNAILISVPLLIWLFFTVWIYRKNILITAITFIVCVVSVQEVLIPQFDVVYPDNFVEESVGLPMTLLCNQKKIDERLLEPECNQFLDSLADEQTWNNKYVLDEYNSIKFTYPREMIKYTEPMRILLWAADVAVKNPRLAFETFNNVTDLVWGISNANEAYEAVKNSNHISSAQSQNSTLNKLGKTALTFFRAPLSFIPLEYIFNNIGTQLLILLLMTLIALYRSGPISVLFAVPILCYHLATMLLLCGQDARFFAFSMVTMLPSALVLTKKPE